jgi:hypothetical protein
MCTRKIILMYQMMIPIINIELIFHAVFIFGSCVCVVLGVLQYICTLLPMRNINNFDVIKLPILENNIYVEIKLFNPCLFIPTNTIVA